MQSRVSHCEDCDVCILDLDHHCVFFDRCIGGANMGLFSVVLCGFFALLIFCVVLAATADLSDASTIGILQPVNKEASPP